MDKMLGILGRLPSIHSNTNRIDHRQPHAFNPIIHLEDVQAQVAGVPRGLDVVVGIAPAQRLLLAAEAHLGVWGCVVCVGGEAGGWISDGCVRDGCVGVTDPPTHPPTHLLPMHPSPTL